MLQPPKPLDEIFKIMGPGVFEHELSRHCLFKKVRFSQPLTEAEDVFDKLQGIGGTIAGDGFVSVFHQSLTPESFARICDAITEVGSIRLRDLLREAWSIYTKDKQAITLEELQAIPVRRFNTRENMDHFDRIGEEVAAEIRNQYQADNVCSVNYARLHRSEFIPIQEQ